jgi:Protein of unknown function (DUF3465)
MNLTTRIFIAAGAIVLVGAIVLLRVQQGAGPSASEQRAAQRAGCVETQQLFRTHGSDAWVRASATVSRILPDQQGRYRHQRFIVSCPDRETILIVNDTSIGERVPERTGDILALRGQYVWNGQGGLIHFTHHDPQGGEGGWILDHGHIYR